VRAHPPLPGGAANLWAVMRAGGVTIAEDWGSDEADRDGEVTLNIPEEHFFPWSPDTPFLYDLTVGTTQGEEEQRDTGCDYVIEPGAMTNESADGHYTVSQINGDCEQLPA